MKRPQPKVKDEFWQCQTLIFGQIDRKKENKSSHCTAGDIGVFEMGINDGSSNKTLDSSAMAQV